MPPTPPCSSRSHSGRSSRRPHSAARGPQQPPVGSAPELTAGLAPYVWAVGALLVLGTLLTVVHLESLNPIPLSIGSVTLIPAVVLLSGVTPFPVYPRPWGVVAGCCRSSCVILLATVDLVIVTPGGPRLYPYPGSEQRNRAVPPRLPPGPANQVLGGHPVLVDTASQYGVGSILMLAGWFEIAPIGYGTFGFLDGVLTALFMAAGYCLLRMAGVFPPLSASALGVGVLAASAQPALSGRSPSSGRAAALRAADGADLRDGGRCPAGHAARPPSAGDWPSSLLGPVLDLVRRGARLHARAHSPRWWPLEALPTARGLRAASMAGRAGRSRVRRLSGCAPSLCRQPHSRRPDQLPDWGQYLAYLDRLPLRSAWERSRTTSPAGLPESRRSARAISPRPRQSSCWSPAGGRTWSGGSVSRCSSLTGATAYGPSVIFGYLVDRSMDHVRPLCEPAGPRAPGRSGSASVLRAATGPDHGRSRRRVLAFALSVALVLPSPLAWSALGPRLDATRRSRMSCPVATRPRAALHRLWHFPAFKRTAAGGGAPARALHAWRSLQSIVIAEAGRRHGDPGPSRRANRLLPR